MLEFEFAGAQVDCLAGIGHATLHARDLLLALLAQGFVGLVHLGSFELGGFLGGLAGFGSLACLLFSGFGSLLFSGCTRFCSSAMRFISSASAAFSAAAGFVRLACLLSAAARAFCSSAMRFISSA